MDHLILTNPEDWTDRDTFETMISAVGGAELDNTVVSARLARRELEAVVPPDHHAVFMAAIDAGTDANAVREAATTRVALVHGIAIGATLATYAEEEPEKLVRTGAQVASALLASGLPGAVAVDVTRTVLEALGRADMAAMLARADARAADAAGATPAGSNGEE